MTEKIITTPQPTADEMLTASLKLVVDGFVNMGYDDKMIFGKVNLILQDFITPEGKFSDEYLKLAKQAIDTRASKEFQDMITMENHSENINLVAPMGIGGNRLK